MASQSRRPVVHNAERLEMLTITSGLLACFVRQSSESSAFWSRPRSRDFPRELVETLDKRTGQAPSLLNELGAKTCIFRGTDRP
jgi:hypothetical protein